jgi:hypothetical protein
MNKRYTKKYKRPTVAQIKAAVLREPNMPLSNLIDELIPTPGHDGYGDDSDSIEQRFDVYGWAMDKARTFRPEGE